MKPAQAGAAIAAISFSIMACTMTAASAQSSPAPGGMTEQEYQQTLQLIKQKQQEMLDKQRQQILQLMQAQQATLDKLKQQQEEEKLRQEQQAILERLKQQMEGDEKQQDYAEKKRQETEGKLRLLLDSGVLQKGVNMNGPGDKPLARDQFAAIVGGALGLDPSQQGSAFGNPTSGWFTDYTEATRDPVVPLAPTDPRQLALLMLQGINGTSGEKPNTPPPGDDRVRQFLLGELGNGLLQDTQSNEKKLRDELIAAADQAGGADIWANYPFYAAGSNTMDINPLGVSSAVYNGIVRGEAGNGLALAGTSQINVDFFSGEASLDGVFDFDSGDTVELGGFYSASSLDLWAEPGAFQGGTIDVDSSFDADFYGPNAEELAGNWSFDVTGGSAAGTASGQFATKR